MSNNLISKVSEYVFHIVSRNEELYGTDFCPFESWKDAERAYLLHCRRMESRNYILNSIEWEHRLNEFRLQKGMKPRSLRLRRRK